MLNIMLALQEELSQVVIDKKIDISDIADYDHDDSIWENIQESIEETDEDKAEQDFIDTVTQSGNYISKDKAKSIALAHAGVTENEIRGFTIELDFDDGYNKYEIEFSADRLEYEYDIDAKTGDILKSDKEYDD